LEDASGSESCAQSDFTSTRIISSKEAVCDGVRFSWWAVGQRPALVTVTNPVFGSKNAFTYADPEAFAIELMRTLLPRGAASQSEQHEP
jgi:hypothetical protein